MAEFDALSQESSKLGELNDCSVKAVALAAGIPYSEAHARMKAEGRKPRRGVHSWSAGQALLKMGFLLKHIRPGYFIERYPGSHKSLLHVTTHHPDRFNEVWSDGRTYLIRTRGHVLVVKDGKNYDWTRGSARRVVSIHEVIKA